MLLRNGFLNSGVLRWINWFLVMSIAGTMRLEDKVCNCDSLDLGGSQRWCGTVGQPRGFSAFTTVVAPWPYF